MSLSQLLSSYKKIQNNEDLDGLAWRTLVVESSKHHSLLIQASWNDYIWYLSDRSSWGHLWKRQTFERFSWFIKVYLYIIIDLYQSYPSFPSIRFRILAANCPVWPNAPALLGESFFEEIDSQFKCWPTFPWYFSRFLSQLTQVHCFLTRRASS